jgi:molecular chaperone DnaK (HSP70)
MNQERRKTIDEAAELIGRAKTLLEVARDEERGAFEDLPESLQGAVNGQAIEASAEKLEEIVDAIETLEEELEQAKGEQ